MPEQPKDYNKLTQSDASGGGHGALPIRRPNVDYQKLTGEPIALPPGIDLQTFKNFIAKVIDVVGEENVTVITGPEHHAKDHYLDPSKTHDMFYINEEDYFISSAVVAPRNVKEVQTLMKMFNEWEIPVWPFSIGRNVGYGGAGPRVRGSIGMDMGKNMNKVLKVDVDGAYALVEPGVTFQALHDYLVDNNLRDKLWIDVPDLGGGSVLGNTIERGVGYTVCDDLPIVLLWRDTES